MHSTGKWSYEALGFSDEVIKPSLIVCRQEYIRVLLVLYKFKLCVCIFVYYYVYYNCACYVSVCLILPQ